MSVGIQNGNAYGDYVVAITITPAAVATITAAEQTFTVPNLRLNDVVVVNPPGLTAGVGLASARVSAANTIAITWINPTAGSLTPPAGQYIIKVTRPESGVPKVAIGD